MYSITRPGGGNRVLRSIMTATRKYDATVCFCEHFKGVLTATRHQAKGFQQALFFYAPALKPLDDLSVDSAGSI